MILTGEIRWLMKNKQMGERNLKEYYKGQFKQTVEELKKNKEVKQSLEDIIKDMKKKRKKIVCPICNATNLDINKFCRKCGIELSYSIQNYL